MPGVLSVSRDSRSSYGTRDEQRSWNGRQRTERNQTLAEGATPLIGQALRQEQTYAERERPARDNDES